ncbi:hypothetical protein V8G54_026733 [Vigna mungo]|uniref:Integrase catalytic domain-containing protein n=1 Tax=Vigna mungo TaxID=3915 RepID=A0AAQ3RQ72_VIGMU
MGKIWKLSVKLGVAAVVNNRHPTSKTRRYRRRLNWSNALRVHTYSITFCAMIMRSWFMTCWNFFNRGIWNRKMMNLSPVQDKNMARDFRLQRKGGYALGDSGYSHNNTYSNRAKIKHKMKYNAASLDERSERCIFVIRDAFLLIQVLELGSQFMNLTFGPTCWIPIGEETRANDGGKSGGSRRALGGGRDCNHRDESRQGGSATRDDDDMTRHSSNLESDESQSSVNDNRGGPNGGGGRVREGNQGGMINWRKRVELPVFEGGEPLVWIGSAKKFFEVQRVVEEEKLELAFISMESYVGSWFRFWREKTKNLSWDRLKRALGIRFGGGTRGMVQAGPVEEYIRDFEVLVEQTTQIPEEQIMGYFLSGLRGEVGDHVGSRDPLNLMTAMRVARDVEKRRMGVQESKFLGENDGFSDANRTKLRRDRRNNAIANGGGSDQNVRNLPYSECGRPFSLDHCCPKRGLRMLILAEEEEETEGDDRTELNLATMELSALSAGGLTTPKTMKGTATTLLIEECYEQVTLELGDAKLVERFYLFELGGVEVILGVEWLEKMGEVMVDWAKLTMVYRQEGEEMTVKGDPTFKRKVVGPRALLKIDRVEAWFMVWELGSMEAQNNAPRYLGLTEKQKGEMKILLDKYDVVFAELTKLPPSREMEHHIWLKEGVSTCYESRDRATGRRNAPHGVIRPSHSSYSSPIILVKKKNGSWRFCIDYRALNRATMPDKFLIPLIEELLDELKGAYYFSKVDLKVGYHQIRMSEKAHQGHYEFVVMSFGLTNVPMTFQSTMNTLFQPYLCKYVLVFLDDILVYNRTWEEHLERVERVLLTLQQDQWVANRRKCEFGQTRVKYLGHVISSRGVEMDDEKIKAIVEWERPKMVKSLRGFLGLTGYYRRFVRDYDKIVRPLTELLKKGGFTWNEKAEETWKTLKRAMTTAPLLLLPDFTQPFQIECDASRCGVEAVLMQQGSIRGKAKQIHLRKGDDGPSVSHSTLETVPCAVAVYGSYGSEEPLTFAGTAQCEGEDEEEKELCMVVRTFWQDFGEITQKVEADGFLHKVMEEIRRDPNTHPAYTLEHERLHHMSTWIPKLIGKFHVTQTGGHSGPLSVPNAVWEELSMDFIVRLPKSQGYDAILVMVDRLSKYAHFLPLKHPYSVKTVAEIFIREVVRLHGIPQSIVTDGDPLFLSMFWKELFKSQGTQLKMSTAYHPEMDGQTEVLLFRAAQGMDKRAAVGGILAVYERTSPFLHRFIPGESLVEALKFHLEKAHDLMVRQANKRRKVANVEVGDWTNLNANEAPSKASNQIFWVVPSDSEVAAARDNSNSSCLSCFTSEEGNRRTKTGEGLVTGPVDRRTFVLASEHPRKEASLLVEWQERGLEGATWEDKMTVREQYPNFNIGDKVGVQGEGIDKDKNRWLVYERRKKGN